MAMTDLIERNSLRQRAMLDAVDWFVVLTQQAANIVIANGAPPAKVVVNRLGVSESIVRRPHDGSRGQGRTRSQVRIGYVGRLDPIKGVLDLVDAIKRVPRDVPMRVEFRGPAQTQADRDTKAAIAARLSGDTRVMLAEAVSPSSIPDVIASYDALCCPSRCLEGGPPPVSRRWRPACPSLPHRSAASPRSSRMASTPGSCLRVTWAGLPLR